jgi:hypothetical protein
MGKDMTTDEQDGLALREAKKTARRAAMAELKRLHADDLEKAREAAKLWFEQNGQSVQNCDASLSPFHQRKLREADPARTTKAAEAVKKGAADAERAQKASREAVKEWRDRNPNKVKKLNKVFKERLKSK